MLVSYGAQSARGLCVHSTRGLTPHHIFIHKEKREIHRTLYYQPLQALNVQITPYNFSVFNQETLQTSKGGPPQLRTCNISEIKKDMPNQRY